MGGLVSIDRFIKLPVSYDLCAEIPISCLLVFFPFLNWKVLVDSFNQEIALEGAWSVIVKLSRIC